MKALQHAACSLPDGPDKVLAGYWCVLVGSRTRHMDLQRCRGEPTLDLDEEMAGYVEVGIGKTKTTHHPMTHS